MGYNFEGTLHSILNKTELNGKWELTYDGKLVITRVNAQFIEDLKFFHELSKHDGPVSSKKTPVSLHEHRIGQQRKPDGRMQRIGFGTAAAWHPLQRTHRPVR